MIDSILYVWLPARRIYPVGPTYLATFIHARHPEIRQRLLDLSLIPAGERHAALERALEEQKPGLVCFSWRDIQIFAPHEGDPSLKYAFNFYYSPNPIKKLTASIKGLGYLWHYYRNIQDCLSYPWQVRRRLPEAKLMIGGGAFGVFADQLIRRLPPGTVGVLGEGEEAVLKTVEGKPLVDERIVCVDRGEVRHGTKGAYLPLDSFEIDLPYLESIFPQHAAYHGEFIGVQTKRGCPYDCSFCEYPYLEGKKVRYRPASAVVGDLEQFYRRWGARRFWFTDAQFFTGKESFPQCIDIMEQIISRRLDIEWSGYIRTSLITPQLAALMVRSGLGDLEVSITSGSQAVINSLHMGFSLDKLYDGCRHLKEAGFKGKLILNYSLNSPGDSEAGLMESVASYKKIAAIMGESQVCPMLFFLGVQPHTDFEQRLLDEGYLYQGYNPLSMNPLAIRKMLYNPKPLSGLIAKACMAAWDKAAWKEATDRGTSVAQLYADESIFAGVVEQSGKAALINLEGVLRERIGSRGAPPAP
ncbi:MAG TPA: radical SAM protein [Nitrospiria bacterium]|nr:radical SAM protein [Nitrospiria bacterium]